MKGISGQRAWQLASFVFFFGLWELAGRWPVSPAFPPFSTTFLAFVEMLRDGSLGKAYLIPLEPLLIDAPYDPRHYNSMERARVAIEHGLRARYWKAPAHRAPSLRPSSSCSSSVTVVGSCMIDSLAR